VTSTIAHCGLSNKDEAVSDQPKSELVVDSINKSSARDVTPCLVRAFWEFPESTHLLPDERNRRRVLPKFLGSEAKDAAIFHTLLAARHDGVIVGAAAWLPPGSYPVSARRQVAEAISLLPVAPWGVGALREARRGQTANRSRHTGRPPHYWLRAIGVEPDRQGEGIGTLLVCEMLQRADQEDRGCFLFTATAKNAAWYESLGFAIIDTYKPTATWPPTWAMWRTPQPPATATSD
jgi:GNAT superfamily N-acetyltransferase